MPGLKDGLAFICSSGPDSVPGISVVLSGIILIRVPPPISPPVGFCLFKTEVLYNVQTLPSDPTTVRDLLYSAQRREASLKTTHELNAEW